MTIGELASCAVQRGVAMPEGLWPECAEYGPTSAGMGLLDGMYGPQLERWLASFEPHQFRILALRGYDDALDGVMSELRRWAGLRPRARRVGYSLRSGLRPERGSRRAGKRVHERRGHWRLRASPESVEELRGFFAHRRARPCSRAHLRGVADSSFPDSGGSVEKLYALVEQHNVTVLPAGAPRAFLDDSAWLGDLGGGSGGGDGGGGSGVAPRRGAGGAAAATGGRRPGGGGRGGAGQRQHRPRSTQHHMGQRRGAGRPGR